MGYATIPRRDVVRESVDVFGGYDHNLRISDGAFYDMKNMTGDHYPVIGTRQRRGVVASTESPTGLIAKDALCWVDGRNFVINGYPVDLGLSDDVKTLVSMGSDVLIFPDKKYINTLDLTDFGSMEAKYTSTGDVTFSLCAADGTEYEDYTTGNTAPEDPANLQLWVDTSGETDVLKQYSEASGVWVTIPTTYIRIHATGIGIPFDQYDGVDIFGVNADALRDINASMVIWAKGDDYIVVTGVIDRTISQESSISVKRSVPAMDFVTECGNRIWGCRYGPAANGEIVNEIYASKLGDFKNWNCFMGLSTDSWVGGVGSDGQWTGAATAGNCPVFFKENNLHKVYISAEGAHQIVEQACRGVQKGCGKSIALVDEVLFYKSRSGVCAYDGSLPRELSRELGSVAYTEAVAASWRSKYYISMKDSSGGWNLFVYDTKKGQWHKEDDFHPLAFCECDGDLFAIDADTKNIVSFGGAGTKEGEVKWMLESGELLMNLPDAKYVSWLAIRMRLEAGMTAHFYAKYDDDEYWRRLFSVKGHDLRSFSAPIRPRRCDHMKLKIEGTGDFRMYSITKTIERGSEVP